LSASSDPSGEINRYSLRYAQSFYQAYWQHEDSTKGGEACGVLQLSLSEKMVHAHQLIASNIINNADELRYVSPAEASHIANTRINQSALYFPKLGWVHPPTLCQWLIKDPHITLVSNTRIASLQKEDRWVLHGVTRDNKLEEQNFSDDFDSVVITNAYDASQFIQTSPLPIKRIRGQVSHYPTTAESAKLRSVVCGKGYIAPSISPNNCHNSSTSESSDQGRIHCLGASFNLHSSNTELTTEDHQDNMANIARQVPDIIQTESLSNEHGIIANIDGRVSFRCVTPDYLPIVGAVPVFDKIQSRYAALSKNGRQIINQAGDYYPDLYINIGFGSRGLAYAPLCSEIIADLINGSPPPIPQYLVQKMNPARFTIRQLIRSAQ
jgi:tRNA 5-methylaminomethyl-2-thiouridine biosynthesis bifunctional protein